MPFSLKIFSVSILAGRGLSSSSKDPRALDILAASLITWSTAKHLSFPGFEKGQSLKI